MKKMIIATMKMILSLFVGLFFFCAIIFIVNVVYMAFKEKNIVLDIATILSLFIPILVIILKEKKKKSKTSPFEEYKQRLSPDEVDAWLKYDEERLEYRLLGFEKMAPDEVKAKYARKNFDMYVEEGYSEENIAELLKKEFWEYIFDLMFDFTF